MTLLLLGSFQEGQAVLREGEPVPRVLSRLQSHYQSIRSFRAHFEQRFQGPGVELIESGVVWMKKPGRMYWEYRHPARKLFVADGRHSYFYVPREKQVVVSDLNLEGTSTPLLFLLGRGDVERDFVVEREEKERPLEPANILLSLRPRQPQAEFVRLILEILPSTSLIRRLVVFDPIGNRNEYRISDFKGNVRIPNSRFRFRPPRGVEILRQ